MKYVLLIGIVLIALCYIIMSPTTAPILGFYKEESKTYKERIPVGHLIKMEVAGYIIVQSNIITDKARLRVLGEPSFIPMDTPLYIEKISVDTYSELFGFKQAYRQITRHLTWDGGKRYELAN